MDEDMWHHASTQKNIDSLKERGHKIVPVGNGELASGLVGEGRMAEPEDIVAFLASAFDVSMPLTGVRSLVTAGPTFERLDPVRFIGNFSSGKMGIAIAEALAAAGSSVTLVLGPTHHRPINTSIKIKHVESAREMKDACMAEFEQVGIAVMAAAVADFAPADRSEEKIKKTAGDLSIRLVKTPDILASLGEIKKPSQTLIGFALETQNELGNALRKLQTKNADAIALNSLKDEGVAFGSDKNKITLLFKDGRQRAFPLMAKAELARELVKEMTGMYHGEKNN
jgi:phosphopantothenoylcysteine decarboxylase/phosphopantothenate--cysteine ligase